MKRNILKTICIILIIGVISCVGARCVFAGIDLPDDMSGIYSGDSEVTSIGSQIIWVVQVCLYGAALIVLMVTGVRYMWAAPEAKAEFKKKMIYMVGGAILLFAAGGIIQIVSRLAGNI